MIHRGYKPGDEEEYLEQHPHPDAGMIGTLQGADMRLVLILIGLGTLCPLAGCCARLSRG